MKSRPVFHLPGRLQIAGALLLVTLLLAACSGTGGGDFGQPAAPPSAAAGAGVTAEVETDAPVDSGDETADANAPATDAPEPPVAEATTGAAPTVTAARTEVLADGFDRLTALVNAGDGSGRLFAVEKVGRIQALSADGATRSLFVDLTDRVGSGASEQGLLGLAFAPDFAESGRFYINYTNRNGDTVVSRLTTAADGNGDPASEEILLTLDQPATNHNGGNVIFGPDGALWIGTGDGGAANDRFGNGQNPATLLGKMLRIDVSTDTGYAIPPDNPWIEADWNGQEVADETWAVGLRNPWRYSFDRATGDLWIADVGQNLWEEVNLVPAGSAGGLNFGWPIQEASSCFQSDNCDASGLVQPVLEYDHSGHCSITGGYVYRGSAAPDAAGAYLFGDYCSGVVWAGVPAEGGAWQAVELLRSGMQISAFGEDEAGELYLVEDRGRIHRLVLE
jgi:glucose/arabinose dehydrogenase